MITTILFSCSILESEYLPTFSYLDPRFHTLTDATNLPAIRETIRAMSPLNCATTKNETKLSASSANNKTAAVSKCKTSNALSFLFASAKPRPTPVLSPIDIELQRYADVEPLPVDQRPQDWWLLQADKLPLLKAIAGRLLCVPAMLPLSDAKTADQRWWMRSMAGTSEDENNDDDNNCLLKAHSMRLQRE